MANAIVTGESLDSRRDAETLLRIATQFARIGVWEIALPSRKITWTRGMNAIYGIPADASYDYEQVRALAHPQDAAAVETAFARAIRGEADYDLSYRVVHADSSIGWLEVRGQVIRDEQGTPVRLIGTTRDVTEHHRANARLEFSEEALRLATDAGGIGTWMLDLITDRLTWTDRTRAMFGISPGVPTTMDDFYAGLHPDDRNATSDAFAASLDPIRRMIYDVEYRTVGKEDGVVRWVAAKGKGLFAGDVCVRAIGTAIDITARKRAEQRQAFLLQLVDDMRQLTDPRAIMRKAMLALGPELDVNRVGYGRVHDDGQTILLDTDYLADAEPLDGHCDLEALGPEIVAQNRVGETVIVPDVNLDVRIAHHIWAAIGTRAFISVPLVREARLRASLYVMRNEPCAWSDEDIALLKAVAERTWDAVERARAESGLRNLNATLERRVEDRTAELLRAEDALRQAQKMEAVGQLTGGIAHDFNNMLAVVLGSLDLLDRCLPREDARARRYVDAAAEGAKRAANLTQRLLAFSRRQPLQPVPVDVNRLVTGMSDLLRHSLGGAVRLEIVLAGGLWPIHADPNQLESVILNLGINARDAMADGGRVTIETQNAHLDDRYVAAEPGMVAGQYVMIAVTDAGMGMSADVIAKAFDPFFTTKPVGKGTGLGLSQVYGYVKQSGGHVKIYSEPGRGTTVKIYLLRLTGDKTPDDEAADATDLPRGERSELILVVEDEPAVRAFSVEALSELGYRVLQADGAEAALKLLDARPDIALMFTDIVMPEVDGAKLAEAARARRPGLKVLFTTGYTRNAVVHNGVVDAGVELIGKPFTIQGLAAKVRAVLDARC